MLSGLGGRPILPTQLYSILFNLALGPLLFALYRSETVGMTVVIGLYLVLSGIERFAEDAFRGEKQTRWQGPLRENQWIAGAAVVVGGLISAVPSDVAGVAGFRSDAALIAAVVAGGLITALALSMDFPTSRVRFSRLSG
jgi:hypothetical protein